MTAHVPPKRSPSLITRLKRLSKQHQSKPSEARKKGEAMSVLAEQHARYSEARKRLFRAGSEPVTEIRNSRVIVLSRPPVAAPTARKAAVPIVPGEPPIDMLRERGWRFLLSVEIARSGFAATPEEVLGRSREGRVVAIRHAAMALVFSHMPLSATTIGNKFGRERSTVLHALAKFKPRRLNGRLAASGGRRP